MALSTPSERSLGDAAERIPVMRLGYSDPALPGEPLAIAMMKMIVALAASVAALDGVRAASAFWIQFSPTPFRGVGTGWQPGTWSMVAGLGLESVLGLASGSTIAGAVQFFRQGPAARRLLLWGAAGSLTASIASFVLSLATYSLLQASGHDVRSAFILAVWRVRWVLGPMVPLLLLLLTLIRPETKRWLSREP